jgi:hypothetical protein
MGVQLPIAHGSVMSSTDERLLRPGPIDFAMLPYQTGALTQDGDGFLVCGASDLDSISIDAMTPEQRQAHDYRACGA